MPPIFKTPGKFMIRCRLASLIIIVTVLCSLFSTPQGHAGILMQEGMNLKAADSVSLLKRLKEKPEEEKFNPGEMIMEHVVDNHEWHIASIGNLNLTIPLPVLIISQGKFYAFWSGKFHNETKSYLGFIISRNGSNKGKIITVQEEMTGKGPYYSFDYSCAHRLCLRLYFFLKLIQ